MISASKPREASISGYRMRRDQPTEEDRRPWEQIQCPHCAGNVWLLRLGIISYWHRNPLRRWWHSLTRKEIA